MKIELTEKNFCNLIDAVEEFWETCNKLDEAFGINITESKIVNLMEVLLSELVESLYDIEDCKENPYWIDDINYYIWELNFGKKWGPGKITIDGHDVPLRNSHDLWKIVSERR